jgi:hypothetical protein
MTPQSPQVPPSLDAIDVNEPCTQSWDAMQGGDRMRFCAKCSLHVHDLSSMRRADAETFVASRKAAGERLCVRFVRRADGTVVTDDRGPVRRAIRRRALRLRAAVVAAFALLFPVAACRQTVTGKLAPGQQAPPAGLENHEETQTLGDLCESAPPAPPAPPKAATPPEAPPPDAPAPPAPPPPPAPAPPAPPPKDTIGKI